MKHGALGALLRREGLYSSHLVNWRRQRDQGELVRSANIDPAGVPARLLVSEHGTRVAIRATHAENGYNSHMKRASVSEAKNRLSALLDRVRHGDTVVIEDRGVPIARLEPITGGGARDGRRARLERRGLVRAPAAVLSDAWLEARPPRLIKGRKGSDIVIEERRTGR